MCARYNIHTSNEIMELVHHIEPENEIKSRPKKIQFHRCFCDTFYDSRPKVFLKSQKQKKKLVKSNKSSLQKNPFNITIISDHIPKIEMSWEK